ncbi:MAG: phosphatase PAP2 family protein [Flavobacteriaceae bacterium]|nr:phosphatase PAP2 family protein [Flavobacteriaceae bacterium]
MLEQLIAYDKELFLFLNGMGTEQFDGFWMYITHKLGALPLYLLLLILLYKRLGIKQTLLAIVLIALLIASTDQLANLFKFGFERWRPCYDEEIRDSVRLVKSGCGGKYGYFSAHAASSMALAVFIGLLLKQYYRFVLLVMVVWAVFVGYSRIYIGVHFPGDVLTGFVIGTLLATLLYKVFLKLKTKKSLIILLGTLLCKVFLKLKTKNS